MKTPSLQIHKERIKIIHVILSSYYHRNLSIYKWIVILIILLPSQHLQLSLSMWSQLIKSQFNSCQIGNSRQHSTNSYLCYDHSLKAPDKSDDSLDGVENKRPHSPCPALHQINTYFILLSREGVDERSGQKLSFKKKKEEMCGFVERLIQTPLGRVLEPMIFSVPIFHFNR